MDDEIKRSMEEAKASMENAAKEFGKGLEAVASVAKEKVLSKLPEKTRGHLEKSDEEFRLATKSMAIATIDKTEKALKDLRVKLEKKDSKESK